ncbi:putative phosphoribosylaminoimidazole carboxylase ATPase subunit, partial [Bordetella bronchiseptica E014]
MTQSSTFDPIAPGDWLGLLGGGQLGRMFCHAAQSLGYKVAVLDPADECPAGMVADLHIQAAYDDADGLARLAGRCRAVTTEFENVPADSLRALAARCRVSPAADAVAVVQDRIAEKTFSFTSQYGDPALGVSRLYVTRNIVKGSAFVNNQGYKNAAADALWDEAATATSDEQRAAAYAKLQKILV